MRHLRTSVLACSLLIAQAGLFAQTAPPAPADQELRAAIQSLATVIRRGTTYQEYTRELQALVALFERHERSGSVSPELRQMKDRLIDARQAWQRMVEMRDRRLARAPSGAAELEEERKLEKAEEREVQLAWREVIRQIDPPPPAE